MIVTTKDSRREDVTSITQWKVCQDGLQLQSHIDLQILDEESQEPDEAEHSRIVCADERMVGV